MIKIIIGIVFIIGGLSGKLVLIGTNSGVALAALGAALVVWGIVRMVRQKQRGGNNNQP
jgi:predicted phage tail protein